MKIHVHTETRTWMLGIPKDRGLRCPVSALCLTKTGNSLGEPTPLNTHTHTHTSKTWNYSHPTLTPAYNFPTVLSTYLEFSFFFSFIFISWRLITLQYCSGFCHTLTLMITLYAKQKKRHRCTEQAFVSFVFMWESSIPCRNSYPGLNSSFPSGVTDIFPKLC